MTKLWLNRIFLRREGREEFWSQGRLLQDPHRLLWSFFPAPEGAPRDFLFRQESSGSSTLFYVLSRRLPERPSPVWEIQSQEFAPRLKRGQVLQFSLRANPVQRVVNLQKLHPHLPADQLQRLQGQIQGRSARRANPEQGKLAHPFSSDEKHDVVMLLKLGQRHLPPEQRKSEPELVQEAGLAWLRRHAEGDGQKNKGSGFKLREGAVQADGYRQHRIARRAGGKRWDDMMFSTVEFSGLLEVTDPDLMVQKLWAGDSPGLGSARGFGCGLMLVRRPGPSWSAGDHEDDEDDGDDE